MTQSQRDRLAVLYKKYELTKDDVFSSPQGWTIITRAGIDSIQAQEDILISYDVVEYTPAVSAAVKAVGIIGERKIETYGEANSKNCRATYPLAMAEKRAMSRIVLKLTGFYALGVFGEDESEDFAAEIKKQKSIKL